MHSLHNPHGLIEVLLKRTFPECELHCLHVWVVLSTVTEDAVFVEGVEFALKGSQVDPLP